MLAICIVSSLSGMAVSFCGLVISEIANNARMQASSRKAAVGGMITAGASLALLCFAH